MGLAIQLATGQSAAAPQSMGLVDEASMAARVRNLAPAQQSFAQRVFSKNGARGLAEYLDSLERDPAVDSARAAASSGRAESVGLDDIGAGLADMASPILDPLGEYLDGVTQRSGVAAGASTPSVMDERPIPEQVGAGISGALGGTGRIAQTILGDIATPIMDFGKGLFDGSAVDVDPMQGPPMGPEVEAKAAAAAPDPLAARNAAVPSDQILGRAPEATAGAAKPGLATSLPEPPAPIGAFEETDARKDQARDDALLRVAMGLMATDNPNFLGAVGEAGLMGVQEFDASLQRMQDEEARLRGENSAARAAQLQEFGLEQDLIQRQIDNERDERKLALAARGGGGGGAAGRIPANAYGAYEHLMRPRLEAIEARTDLTLEQKQALAQQESAAVISLLHQIKPPSSGNDLLAGLGAEEGDQSVPSSAWREAIGIARSGE